jgi:hypothetical protein
VKPWLKRRYAKGDVCGGERPYWSEGQERLAALLRWCPAPGVERPTRPTSLAYAERGNPVVVWSFPVTLSQERANPIAGTVAGTRTPPFLVMGSNATGG